MMALSWLRPSYDGTPRAKKGRKKWRGVRWDDPSYDAANEGVRAGGEETYGCRCDLVPRGPPSEQAGR